MFLKFYNKVNKKFCNFYCGMPIGKKQGSEGKEERNCLMEVTGTRFCVLVWGSFMV